MKKIVSILALLALVGSFAGANEHEATEEGHGTGAGHHGTNFFPKKQPDVSKTTRPAKVQLLEPKALSTVTGASVTLKWAEAKSAEAYKVQVATDANFKWLIADENAVQGTSFQVNGLEAGKSYFWRVFAKKDSNDAGWTSGFADFSSFKVK